MYAVFAVVCVVVGCRIDVAAVVGVVVVDAFIVCWRHVVLRVCCGCW